LDHYQEFVITVALDLKIEGQLLVASLIAQSWTVMLYLPVLAFMGILAGIAVGIAANFLFEHIDILRRLRYDRTKRRKKGATHENSSHVA
ncbi:MAG: Gx transporter family protein, partial [Lacticaseibacillus paracasei]